MAKKRKVKKGGAIGCGVLALPLLLATVDFVYRGTEGVVNDTKRVASAVHRRYDRLQELRAFSRQLSHAPTVLDSAPIETDSLRGYFARLAGEQGITDPAKVKRYVNAMWTENTKGDFSDGSEYVNLRTIGGGSVPEELNENGGYDIGNYEDLSVGQGENARMRFYISVIQPPHQSHSNQSYKPRISPHERVAVERNAFRGQRR